ncbi:transcriptional regulator [Actinotignum sp. SLA_B059]|uniref:type II toxin-antitoxin system HicB family antitoxin n=1 Tax=Actinotignum sp. SLA_B059 TaxID=3083287 RepID=UPI002A80079E|nr:transcriptional regulator [Actinotignum sp. SLA_B059]MDY5128050.1 transcriptional regulator [Actinotignum sp. SLA_B059]
MSAYTARATRDEGWWVVEVDEVPGLFTQARRLDQIPDMVRDALALFPEVEGDPDAATIDVIPCGKEAQQARLAFDLHEQATKDMETATRVMASTAQTLSQEGISYRDIGSLLGISFQHAHKLATA